MISFVSTQQLRKTLTKLLSSFLQEAKSKQRILKKSLLIHFQKERLDYKRGYFDFILYTAADNIGEGKWVLT